MGRKKKKGFEYFPLDVDMMQDIRMRKLIRRKRGEAVTVYTFLLCNIYKDGYYLEWDEDTPFILSEQTGFDEDYIIDVVNQCLELGFFSKELFDEHKILTSASIQQRYMQMSNSCGRELSMCDFLLIETKKNDKKAENSEEMPINSEGKPFSSEEMPINSPESTQRKVKENIIIINNNNIPPLTPPRGDDKGDVPKQKRLKTSLQSKAKNVYEKFYESIYGVPYYWVGKDAGAMRNVLKKLRFQHHDKDPTDDELITSLSDFLYSITDGWIYDNMSVSILDSKFNEIVSKYSSLNTFPWDKVVEKFNSLGVIEIQILDSARKRKFAMIMNEYGKDKVGKVYSKIKQSDRLRGYTKDGWKADFDFIFDRNNFKRILEGVFDNKRTQIGE